MIQEISICDSVPCFTNVEDLKKWKFNTYSYKTDYTCPVYYLQSKLRSYLAFTKANDSSVNPIGYNSIAPYLMLPLEGHTTLYTKVKRKSNN